MKGHEKKRQKKTESVKERLGIVHYDPGSHMFVHPKEILACGVLCGDPCPFYTDAVTNLCRKVLSEEDLLAMIPVPDPSDCKFAQRDGTTRSWRVKGKWDYSRGKVVR